MSNKLGLYMSSLCLLSRCCCEKKKAFLFCRHLVALLLQYNKKKIANSRLALTTKARLRQWTLTEATQKKSKPTQQPTKSMPSFLSASVVP